MKITVDDELRPLIELVVTETLDRLEADRARLSSRLAFTEAEAADDARKACNEVMALSRMKVEASE